MKRSAALILALFALGSASALADDPSRTVVPNFVAREATLEQAIAELARVSGVTIEIDAATRERFAAALGQSVDMVMRGSTVGRLLDTLLMGTDMIHVVEDGKIVVRGIARDGEPEAAAKAGAPGAVLLARFVRRDPVSYSGIVGARFWFQILEVKRFERASDVPDREARFYPHEFAELKKRAAMLDRYNLLEVQAESFEDDRQNGERVADLTRRLEPGKVYVLARSTTLGFATTGTVVDGKWASAGPDGLVLWPHEGEDLERIDEMFAERRPSGSGGDEARDPPDAPRIPGPGDRDR